MARKYKNIYVAASSQHVGKTTTTLGLVSAFMKKGLNVGYCKPVGQKHLTVDGKVVDKDTVLFADLIDFEIEPKEHSPVILGSGATVQYLDNPNIYDPEERIKYADEKLSAEYDLVIYEGTGHPGVGSVADVSNAHVAKLLDAGVVMVVEAGIGNSIDMFNMTTSLFREKNVPILGVIINKVRKDKIDKIRTYINKWMKPRGYRILGLIPYDESLAFPVMSTICEAVNGTIIANEEYSTNRVSGIMAGSLLDLEDIEKNQDRLLVTSSKAINNAINKIELLMRNNNIEENILSGIVATGQGFLDSNTIAYIEKHKIPLIRTDLDTYGSVIKISNIEVKINRSTLWKVEKAIHLIDENIDLNDLLVPV